MIFLRILGHHRRVTKSLSIQIWNTIELKNLATRVHRVSVSSKIAEYRFSINLPEFTDQ